MSRVPAGVAPSIPAPIFLVLVPLAVVAFPFFFRRTIIFEVASGRVVSMASMAYGVCCVRFKRESYVMIQLLGSNWSDGILRCTSQTRNICIFA